MAQEPMKKDKLISIDYKNASLTSVLKALAYSNDLNLVVTKDIEGVVSANLSDVTVDEALQAILSVNGYTFTREGTLIYVFPGSGMEGFGQETITMRLSYLTAKEAKQLLTKVISPNGDIQVNEATNSIVVTDYERNIDKVRLVLQDVDIPPIQVLIEAKILDIQAKAFENFGTTTSVTYDPRGTSTGGGIFGRSTEADESVTGSTSLAGPSSTLGGGQLTLTTVLKDLNISMTIDALIQQNKAHLLASPSIATINGKEARIIIGDKVPIIEKTTTQTSTTESTEFVDVGTTLRVVPQVSPDGWITMNVHPEVSSVTSNTSAGPNIATREADAVVRVKDGQTIIIGGLISKQDDRIEGGVPGLKSIPVVGKLFSNRSKDIQEKELTVFITPYILSPEKNSKTKEVTTNMQTVGESNLVAKLLEHARNLDDAESVESANKSFQERKQAILSTYQMIANQFPDADEADMALFRAGEIYYYFKKYTEAIGVFNRLIEQYPYSSYKTEAVKYLERCRERRIERENIINQRLLSLEKENNMEPF
ncbi:MAG: secretin and TonB N-terminal domain-containing protein [Candidatus Omnitrophica bacterium]|nr:secretin and TonB N-terminal domain-containing protein [Candidatus Omnitrophota bacterium]MCA9404934.1 secretin and TonB N-terminal domain-containing protein [Candidatus Omnitrophota bacterium]